MKKLKQNQELGKRLLTSVKLGVEKSVLVAESYEEKKQLQDQKDKGLIADLQELSDHAKERSVDYIRST